VRFTKMLLACAAAALVAAMLGGLAAADSGRATKGDAQAVLEAFGNGGRAILLHSGTAVGAPSEGTADGIAIRPLGGSPFDGEHYCALDWHTILIPIFDQGPRQAFAAELDGTVVTFTLDGAPLAVTQTAIKRFLTPQAFGLTDAHFSQWGRVMSPADLAPGTHTLTVLVTTPGMPDYTDGITFFVDPAGTGACL
jgi:hypothetical protein